MAISVSEAMQLKKMKSLTLIAGRGGLNKQIDKIGILDHEIVEGIVGDFMTGDFVLTTFTAARNDVKLLEKCVKDLITCNVSALAVKEIYYKTLPKHIIDIADAGHLPIFMVKETVFFEDIIEDLMAGMQSRSYLELIASKIEILFKNDLKKPVIKELAYELNRLFEDEHIVIYCKEKKYRNDDQLLKIAEKYQRSRLKSVHHSVFKYNEGLMIFLTYQKISEKDVRLDFNHLSELLGIEPSEYFIGYSKIGYELNTIDGQIKEAVYASKTGEVLNKDDLSYKEMGIYKILLPYANEKWLKAFTEDILGPIKSYDQGKLHETAKVYIEFHGDVKLTAEKLFQHKNTIRYRLNKMQEILEIKHEGEFYEQLSIAIKSEALITDRREH